MIQDDITVGHFRHYIYGVAAGREDEFLTTTLSGTGAVEWAEKHQALFKSRFDHYSIRKVDVEVNTVHPPEAP